MKLQKFEFDVSTHARKCTKHLTTNFLRIFKKREPSTKFYAVFDIFSRTYEFKKFLLIKLCPDVSDVIHANNNNNNNNNNKIFI